MVFIDWTAAYCSI